MAYEMVMPYHLHMPSYFLETFTEYPKVNVSVAASLASVGPDNMQVSIQSTPGFTGDTQKVEIKNEQVHAVVEVYSATSEIAGWSVVNTLLNITSPIVF
ncbi:aspartate dehydrogenase domain-containing protein, partial [Phocaeicola vulgatus]